MIAEQKIIAVAQRILKHPQGTICKHWVVLILLDLLEREGWPISMELAKAVVDADDDKSLELLEKFL
jgi:hypothetical protein